MAAPAFAQTPSPEPAVEAKPPAASALSEAAAERAKALGAYSEALAVSAATWGSPLVTMYCLRHNDAVGPHPKAAVNAIWWMEDISTPALSQEAGNVTPNVNTLYGFGFLDLAAEPVILSVPDSHGRYYMVEIVDFWTNAFAYAGGVATGYKGGKFALVGPGWKGRLPRQRPKPSSMPLPLRGSRRGSHLRRHRPITMPRQILRTRNCRSARWPSRTRFSFGKFLPMP